VSEGVRVVLAGASTPEGRAVREKLEASALQVGRLTLYDVGEAGGLSEFRGEPLHSSPLGAEALEEAELAFLCGEPDHLASLQSRAAEGEAPVISLAPPGRGAPEGPYAWPDDGTKPPEGGLVYVPGSDACLLLRLLLPLERAAGIEEATGVLFRSAWQEGPHVLDAMLQQTLAVLNMRPVPREVLQEQRAFNLLPCAGRERSGQEVERTLGLAEGSVRVSAVAAPYFHGCAAAVWARTRDPLTAADAERLLRDAPGIDVRCLPPVADDRGLWLWGASDPVAAGAAVEAVKVAETMFGGRGRAAGETS